jgi:CheY-like chemotaxis protein
VAPTVLIASPEFLPGLQQLEELGETVAFADTDALKALDFITRQRPKIVALERDFAATSRGTALINRIKADPSLTGCEIRIVTHDNGNGAAPSVAVEAAATVVMAAPLDQTGRRRSAGRRQAGGARQFVARGGAGRIADDSETEPARPLHPG